MDIEQKTMKIYSKCMKEQGVKVLEKKQKKILGGNYILSDGKTLEKAQKIRRLICEEFDMFFKDYDFIILPTTPSTAFKIGEIQDEMLMYMQDYFTVAFSLAGLPCISIPNGFDEKGLPIGLQIVSAPFSREKTFKFFKISFRTLEKSG